jgi:hypothetical protein
LEKETLLTHKDVPPFCNVLVGSMEGHIIVSFAIIDLEPKENSMGANEKKYLNLKLASSFIGAIRDDTTFNMITMKL